LDDEARQNPVVPNHRRQTGASSKDGSKKPSAPVLPDRRLPYKLIAAAMAEWARTQARDNPTMKHLIAISRFFGVPPTYFFPDDCLDENAIPAELAAALGDDQVRVLALRAVGLSTSAW
jgi:hypothetical protein